MGLTWDEFLKLATVISNLRKPILNFHNKQIGIKELNRRVAAAAKGYLECFNDLKYMQFMNEVRISFSIVIIIFWAIDNKVSNNNKYITLKGLLLFRKFQNWTQNLEIFYRLILALVMTKNFRKNGKLLTMKWGCISMMVMSEDGAVIIANWLGTMRLWKTRPIWKFSIFS